MYTISKSIDIIGLRYPKIFEFQNKLYLIGSKKYKQEKDITKYGIYLLELNTQFDLKNDGHFIELNDYKYLDDITLSSWIRDIYIKDDTIYIHIEIKQNINNNTFYDNNYLVKTTDLIHFSIVHKYDITDFFFKELTHNNSKYIFTSKIEKDKLDKDYFWGIYLFQFIKDNKIIRPTFDCIVDYSKDKGHLLHNIEYNEINNNYTILFSIRHKKLNENNFYYTIYTADSNDLINYYNTTEVIFNTNSNILNSEWFSYPHKFNYNNNEYIICNQDDFGKNSKLVLFKKEISLEQFVLNKYNLNIPTNKLNFTIDKKYIFYNEKQDKTGNRYNSIIDNNEQLSDYSTYSPSCIKLYDLFTKLNISSNDSIIDIGSGRGYCLSIFNLFNFHKICGLEISSEDVDICKENLKNLNINNIELMNDDVLNFNNYSEYNYFYFYNPFDKFMFEQILKKIIQNNNNSILIYKNIHKEEIDILNKNNYTLSFQEEGLDRDYYIFTQTNL